MAKWIWYPGSFELYHGMLLHNRRTYSKTYEDNGSKKTKSVYYYPMWRVDAPRHNACLFKKATVKETETVEFFCNTESSAINVDGRSYPCGSVITLAPGEHKIYMEGFKSNGFPAFYCKGKTFATDRSWLVYEHDDKAFRHAGESEYYTKPTDNPEIFKFSYKQVKPAAVESVNGGVLYDFGKEVFGNIIVKNAPLGEILIIPGESREEALDYEFANLAVNASISDKKYSSEAVAFRYLFTPNIGYTLDISMMLEYLPLKNKGSFKCDNELINKLWETCRGFGRISFRLFTSGN